MTKTDRRDRRLTTLVAMLVVGWATIASSGCTMPEWYVAEDRRTYEALEPYVRVSLERDLALPDDELQAVLDQLPGEDLQREDLEATHMTLDAWRQRLEAEERAQ